MADQPTSGAGQITLDQLISSSSSAVLRALQEHQSQAKGLATTVHPRIWVGYWIDLAHGIETLPGTVTGGNIKQQ
jgi:hypothetical protein